jgi:hypothetical protein
MATFEQIVKSHRGKQLSWGRASERRISRILQRAANETLVKLKAVEGSGKLVEHQLSSLLNDLTSTLNALNADYSELMHIHLLGASQIAASREEQIAKKLLDGDALDKATYGLKPEFVRSADIANIGSVSVRYGLVAERAVNIEFARVFADGLTLSDRIWRLGDGIRREIGDKIVQAIAQGKSAKKLGRELQQYLTESGKGNARYNALRLARTEINTAHREGHIQSLLDDAGQLKGYVHAIGWRLSASHRVPDICDIWASRDIDNLGRGNYLPANVPIDHAHGLCMTVTILKSEPDMQFTTKEAKPDDVPAQQLKTYGIEETNE